MSFELGEAFVKVRADTDGTVSEAEGKLSGGFSKLGKGLGIALGAGIAGAVGVAAVGKWALGVNAELGSIQEKADIVFGSALGDVQEWASANAMALGVTRSEATSLATSMGDLLIPMGFAREEAAKMSTDTTELAGALSEWTNGQFTTAESSAILTKAMLGEREGLKALGISITQAELDQRLLEKGQQDLTGAALQQASAIATQEMIFEKSADAITAFERAQQPLVTVQKEVSAITGEWTEALAAKFLPALEGVAAFVSDTVVPKLSDLLATFERGDGIVDSFAGVFYKLFANIGGGGGVLEAVQGVMASALDWLVGDGIPMIFQFIMDSRERLFSAAMVLFPALLDAIIEVIPQVVEFITGTMIPQLLDLIVTAVPQLLEAALTLFGSLLDAVVEVLPGLLASVLGLLPELVATLLGMVPQLLEAAVSLFMALLDAVLEVLPQLLSVLLGDVLPSLLETILGMVPQLLKTAVKLFLSLVKAVIEVLPKLLDILLGTVLPEVLTTVLGMLPELLVAAIEVFMALVTGVLEVLPQLLGTIITQVIPDVIMAVLKAVPQLLVAAIEVFMALVSAVIDVVPKLLTTIGTMLGDVLSAIRDAIPKMLSAGLDIVTGLWDGVKQKFVDVLAWYAGIGARIRSAIPNPLDILKAVGRKIIDGFISSITGAFGRVRDTFSGLTNMIPDWKGPPEKDATLLQDAGHLIMGGLVDGMSDKEDDVRRMLQGLTGMLQGELGGDLGVSVGATGSAALAGAGGAGGGSAFGGGGRPSVEVHQTFQGYSPDQIQHATQRALRMEVDAWTLSG